MEQRDRLIEIIQNSVGGCARNWAEVIADGLLADGWMRPPCKAGDKAYHLTSIDTLDELNVAVIFEGKVCSISKEEEALWFFCRYDNGLNFWYTERDIGKTVFLTREEAERELERRKNERDFV